MKPKFVLFDIDGTLVGIDGAGGRSLNRALLELTGIPCGFRGINFAGKTDSQIIREGLNKLSLSDEKGLRQNLMDLYLAYLREELPRGKAHVKVGVERLLRALSGSEGVYLGLLTGNVETGARLKLNPFGLNQFFPTGAFGSDSEDRNLLLPIAVKRLQESESISVSYERCVVIGDTPRDVECAKVHGSSCVAVATGTYSLEELEKTEADFVIPDLSNTGLILDWIYNSPQTSPSPQ
jgi:phosphoglycolate phosphatase-like HAD superfamily hydrolase